MIKLAILIGGAFVGFTVSRLYDFLSKNGGSKYIANNFDLKKSSFGETNNKSNGEANQDPNSYYHSTQEENNTFDLSPLAHIMKRYGIDISNNDSLYLLINKIRKSEYRSLLLKIQNETSNSEQLVSLLKNLCSEEFVIPKSGFENIGLFVKLSRIDQLLQQNGLSSCLKREPAEKVELLINMSYSKAIESLKNEFGDLFGKLIEAYENNEDSSSYYNQIIEDIKLYSGFIK